MWHLGTMESCIISKEVKRDCTHSLPKPNLVCILTTAPKKTKKENKSNKKQYKKLTKIW